MYPITRALTLHLLVLLAPLAGATAPLDGPATCQHPMAEPFDLHTFPSPPKPGYLTLISDMYPLAPPDTSHASDAKTLVFNPSRRRPGAAKGH